MKHPIALSVFLLFASCYGWAQGKQDPNMRQIHRDLSPKTSRSAVAIPHHSYARPKGGTSAAASANAELTKLEQSNKLATAKPKHAATTTAALPKEPSGTKTGSGLASIPPRHKNQMTTNNSQGHSRLRSPRGRSH
jgi:hypothetical protein